MDHVTPGQRIDDFTVAYRISSGMNSDVLAVWHHTLLTPLICKRINPQHTGNTKWKALLREEGHALSTFNHPGVVRLVDQRHDVELPYLLLEHVGDRTLRDILRDEGPLNQEFAVRVVQHLCAAVAHIHSRGYLHRDLKPSNIIVRNGRPVLLDFGVVWRMEAGKRPPDRSGTSQYLSPEQIRREELSPATDIYLLGVLLFELISGRRPFNPGADRHNSHLPLEARYPQLIERYVPLHIAQPDVCNLLANVAHRCLDPVAARRYQSAVELMQELDTFTEIKVWPRQLGQLNPFT